MEHVVFSGATDGSGQEYRRVPSLEEAVRVVEHLRNDLGVTESSVFALTRVPLAFRTYYRVEVTSAPPAADRDSSPVPVLLASEAPLDAPAAPEEPAPDSDERFTFEPNADVEVPAMLPDAASNTASNATIPASRQEQDGEHSLGYFAR